jgi:hypothetical protein
VRRPKRRTITLVTGLVLVLTGDGPPLGAATEDEVVRARIYKQLDTAGWKGERPEVYEGKGERWITGELPLRDNCKVMLYFEKTGWGYTIDTIVTPDDEYVDEMTGPRRNRIEDLQNFSRKRLEDELEKAGFNCLQ